MRKSVQKQDLISNMPDLISMLRSTARTSGSWLVDKLRGLEIPDEPERTPLNFGIPEDELKTQVEELKSKNVPQDTVMRTIDKHEGITDKEGAKRFAKGLFEIEKVV